MQLIIQYPTRQNYQFKTILSDWQEFLIEE